MQITHDNPGAEEDLLRMRGILEHWQQLHQGKQDDRRRLERRDYTTTAFVSIDSPSQDTETPQRQVQATFEAWTRDLSPTGVSLLFPRCVTSREVGDAPASEVDLYEVLHRGDEIQVGLQKSQGRVLWMRSVIRRLRRVQDLVLDCGVEFVERLETR